MFHSLRNVARSRPDATNRQENIIIQKIRGQGLDLLWEGGREHERLTILFGWKRVLLDDSTNLRLNITVLEIDFFSYFKGV